MFKLDDHEMLFIGVVLEGLLYGLYSGLFVIFLHYQSAKKDDDKKNNIVYYSTCALYALSVGVFVSDIMLCAYQEIGKSMESVLRLAYAQLTLFGLCDFIAQFILIYRCWIVWGRNTRVVIIPSILTFAFLVFWVVGGGVTRVSSGELVAPKWGPLMALSGLALSLTINALMTSLIVFKILKVFRQVKATSNAQILSATRGDRLQHTILVLIESGMALFSIQLIRLVVIDVKTDAAYWAYNTVSCIHDMLTGIIPTIIVVRISMGLSFHDKKSMEAVAIRSLRFPPANHLHIVMQTESISIDDQDSKGDDIDVQKSNKISI